MLTIQNLIVALAPDWIILACIAICAVSSILFLYMSQNKDRMYQASRQDKIIFKKRTQRYNLLAIICVLSGAGATAGLTLIGLVLLYGLVCYFGLSFLRHKKNTTN